MNIGMNMGRDKMQFNPMNPNMSTNQNQQPNYGNYYNQGYSGYQPIPQQNAMRNPN